jgi:hypothetical protein
VLTWSAPPGAPLQYEIRGSDAAHTWNLSGARTPDASTHYTIPTLSPGTYSFTVRAVFAASVSAPSNEVTVVIR